MLKKPFPFANVHGAETGVVCVVLATTRDVYVCSNVPAGTMIRPMSGIYFEAVQLLHPYLRFRPVSAPYEEMGPRPDSAMSEDGRWSKSSGTTAVDALETPHLYTSIA